MLISIFSAALASSRLGRSVFFLLIGVLPYIILIPNLSFLGVFILGSRDIRCSKGCNHQSSSSPLLVRSIFFYKKNQDSLWKELFKQHVRFMDVNLKRMNASMK